MADKYAVTKARLDGLSTSVQELTGSANGLTPEQMQEQLDAANAEKEEQATIIGELTSILAETSTVLDGKAGGSGGAAVETCELEITFSGNAAGYPSSGGARLSYSQIISGSITTVDETLSSDSVVLSGVPIGSIIVIYVDDGLGILGTLTTNNVKIVSQENRVDRYSAFAPTGSKASWEVG